MAAQSGESAFNMTYSALYGSRWEGLKTALLGEKDLRPWKYPGRPPYLLDSASILAALSLPLKGAKKIFDCCAAPGGKSLVLASMMDSSATLRANDRSSERAGRLRGVLRDCLPPEILSRVTVTVGDAARLARRRPSGELSAGGLYDAVFLDAPCSSERHVLASPYHLARWSPARSRNLAASQWALLSAAFRLLAPGGVLVYATCALHPQENDGVVQRLFKKFPGTAEPAPLSPAPEQAQGFFPGPLPEPEKTDAGYRILPDSCAGAGPMFFACVKKRNFA
jgi:16S rRNA C967 or C1407 C5-methylase (RsmB/RsmF family)